MNLAAKSRDGLYQSVAELGADLRPVASEQAIATLGAELSLFLWLEIRLGKNLSRGSIKRWRHLVRSLGTREIVRRVALAEDQAASAGWLIHEIAIADSEESLRRVRDSILDAGALSTPLPPVRRLELLYFLSFAGLKLPKRCWRSVLRESGLVVNSAVLHGPRDIYALTHLIFYVTDFGNAPSEILLPRETKVLRQHVAKGFEWALEKCHVDLICETGLAAICLEDPDLFQKSMKAIESYLASSQSPIKTIPETAKSLMATYHPVLVYCISHSVNSPLKSDR